jgi:hypothetical protein
VKKNVFLTIHDTPLAKSILSLFSYSFFRNKKENNTAAILGFISVLVYNINDVKSKEKDLQKVIRTCLKLPGKQQ